MPEYKTPGVYVEEVDLGPKPIAGVSTSTAGFLGETERGPTEPRLVTSFAAFERTFGGYAQYERGGRLEDTYLAYAVEGFFRNGGQRAYVGRIVEANAVGDDSYVASATLEDGTDDVLTASAVGPGEWGHNVAILVENASNYDGENDLFKLTVKYWADEDDVPRPADADSPTDEEIADVEDAAADVEEVYDDLSPREGSADFYETRINGTSNLLEVERENGGRPIVANGEDAELIVLDDPDDLATPGRSDYQGNDEKGEKTGLEAFAEIDGISMVCVPDQARGSLDIASDVADHCAHEDRQDRIALLQAGQNFDVAGDPELPFRSEYAAFYCPWIEVYDPITDRPKEVPPGGHVAGIYARSDAERGVHKAPANEVVRGAESLEFPITDGEQATLNPRGINCIRSFRGRGIRVWGARTMASDPSWKYVNVRRLFLYLRESIDEGTQWAVFEPNDEDLWARVRQTITNFLRDVWEDGALMGSTPEEAFYVKCDRTTMTQSDIDNGRLICEIGVAPVKPAEFVVFRIAQWTGGE